MCIRDTVWLDEVEVEKKKKRTRELEFVLLISDLELLGGEYIPRPEREQLPEF
jgi:hypothetical protein